MSGIQFMTKNSKRIMLLDFSKTNSDESLKLIETAKQMIRKEPENSVLTLTDVTDAKYDKNVTQGMKDLSKHNKPYVKAGAVVGVTGMKKIVFQGILTFSGKNLSLFDDRDSAISWLITQ